MKNIAVLITCHNRKEKTLTSLKALFQNKLPESFSLYVYLVDDGSKDGTQQAIHEKYPDVNVIKGDGNLYWNGGMRVAFNAAMEKGFDYYLWLNDDTYLYPSAIETIISTSSKLNAQINNSVVVVGSTQASLSGELSYGGLRRISWWRPLTFTLVSPSNIPEICDTINGNCVLIPREIASTVGNLEESFIHSMGDIDYGLRLGKAGFCIYVSPGFVGQCQPNPIDQTFLDNHLSLTVRWKKILNVKGLPPRQRYILARRHAGLIWPFVWVWPYIKLLFARSL
jgi:GT2 family glycosyltransferase